MNIKSTEWAGIVVGVVVMALAVVFLRGSPFLMFGIVVRIYKRFS